MTPAGKPFDPKAAKVAKEHKAPAPLLAARFAPDGKSVFAACQDNRVHRLVLAEDKWTSYVGHETWPLAVAFAKSWVVSCDSAGRVLVWPADGPAPKPIATVDAHIGWARSVATSPDGTLVASAGNDGSVRVWTLPDLKPVRTIAGHGGHVYRVRFHPDGKRLVSADHFTVLREWELATGKLLREVKANGLTTDDAGFAARIGGARDLCFSPDGSQLAVAGIAEVSNAFAGVGQPLGVLFDWTAGKEKLKLKPAAAFQGTLWGVAFHPSGYLIGGGGGGGNGAAWFWKPGEGAATHELKTPRNVRDMSLSPDGTRLALAGADGTLVIVSL